MGGRNSGRWGARPGVTPGPLTKLEHETLKMLSEGFSPKELVRKGEHANTVRNRIHRMRLKFNAFTTAHMVTIAFKEGILK